jgi:molybdopterin converting factor small subunit
MTSVRVKVLFFGMLKDIAGRSEDHIEVAGGERLGEIFDRSRSSFHAWDKWLPTSA